MSWFTISHSVPQKLVLIDVKHASVEPPELIGQVTLGQVDDIPSAVHVKHP